MSGLRLLALSFLSALLIQPLFGDETMTRVQDKFKSYVNDVVTQVREADDPAEKRRILETAFGTMKNALDRVEGMVELNEAEREYMDMFRGKLADYDAELGGTDGMAAVPDAQLDNFAGYVQQDLEQARTVTISLTALLLIIIIVLLIA